jgi:hypothetical protein
VVNAPGPEASFYRALTTLAEHCLMKIRDNMNAVIESLQKEHGLLAAYLEGPIESIGGPCRRPW